MRRFEHDGKFWEVKLVGARVEMRWGEIGKPPRLFDRGFNTTNEAETFAERQIMAQRERGFVEKTAAPVVEKPEITVERQQRFIWQTQFEEVTQEGTKLTVRGGKIANGRDVPDRDRLDVANFRTVYAASIGFDERCAEIRSRGGHAVDPEPTHATHINADLEAQCEAAPLDDPSPWAVYADWLIARGDARGEIAALQQAGRTADAKRLLGIHLMDLAGTTTGRLAFEFRHGFATHAHIELDWPESDDLLEDITRALLAAPLGRFLDSLRFGLAESSDQSDWGPTLDVVAESARARSIRSLFLDGDPDVSVVMPGGFTGVWPKLPALERLHVRCGAGGELGRLDLPNLTTLIRETSELSRAELDEIIAGSLPALQHLELWFGTEDYGGECGVDDLRPIFDGCFPTLRHLGLVGCEFADAALAALVRSELLPQLRSLDLSQADVADALVANADAFRQLEKILVSKSASGERLLRALPNVVLREAGE